MPDDGDHSGPSFGLRSPGSALLVVPLLLFAACEGSYRLPRELGARFLQEPFHGRLWPYAYPVLYRYLRTRFWVTHHPVASGAIAIVGAGLVLLVWRQLLLLWKNQIVPRLSGTFLAQGTDSTFPMYEVPLNNEIKQRPPGRVFVGLSPRRRLLSTAWEPIYLDERLRSTHLHVLGKTGSGKTQSVIFPLVYQDILDGKGVVVLSAKGSGEEIETMKALALLAGREADLRVFALPAWNRPQIPTHAYNLMYVEPATPDSPGGDVVATAERVFSVLPMGGHDYYDQQAQIFFKNLCRALHGMRSPDGFGIPFTMRDIAACLKGVANAGELGTGLDIVVRETTDAEAAYEITSHVKVLDRDIRKVLSGLIGATDQFLAPMVNAYAPDIIMKDVLEEQQIVYVQLPSNLFKIQAPALGKIFLQDIQQEGSLRQVERATRNQTPFAVFVDEFATFADLSILQSLSQLRDAKIQYTLAHQSIADLEIVSKEFAASAWDNTRVKFILNQDNPALCEQVAKSIGTQQDVQLTIRRDPGPLFTSLHSGVASSRQVEGYKLHPNKIKNLARAGQAYLYSDEMLKPVCLGRMPPVSADYALPARDQSDPDLGLRLHDRVLAIAADAQDHDADTDANGGAPAARRPAPRRKPKAAGAAKRDA